MCGNPQALQSVAKNDVFTERSAGKAMDWSRILDQGTVDEAEQGHGEIREAPDPACRPGKEVN